MLESLSRHLGNSQCLLDESFDRLLLNLDCYCLLFIFENNNFSFTTVERQFITSYPLTEMC